MTSAELSGKLDRSLEGESRVLTGAASLEDAATADLAFVAAEKSFALAQASAAGCLIAPFSYSPANGQSIIRSQSPRALFAQALPYLYPEPALRPGVHKTSRIDSGVAIAATAQIEALCTVGKGSVIGPETRIAAGCHIGRNVQIGAHCRLYPGVVIYDGTRIGARVILHAGSVIGADGFGYAPQDGQWSKFPQVGRVEIEDDVEIGANSCVDRAALGHTRIGAGSKLDNLVHIGHNCNIGRHVVIAAQTGLSGGVVIGDGAIIGGQVGIGDKARIEPGVVLGSGSGVLTSKIVRAGSPLWGTPARPLKQYLSQLAQFARLPRLRAEMDELRQRLARLEKQK